MTTRTKFTFDDLRKKYDLRQQNFKLSHFTFNTEGSSNFPIGNAHSTSISNGIRGQEDIRNINNPENLEFHSLFDVSILKEKEISDINIRLTSNNFLQDEHDANTFYGQIDISSLINNPKQIYEITVEGLTEGAEDNIRLVENVEWVIVGNHVDGSLKLKHNSDGNDIIELKYKQNIRNTSVVLQSTSWITRSDSHHTTRTGDHHTSRSDDHHTTRTGNHHHTRSSAYNLRHTSHNTLGGWYSGGWGLPSVPFYFQTQYSHLSRSHNHWVTRAEDHHTSRSDDHHYTRPHDHHNTRSDQHYVTLTETTSILQTSYIENGVKNIIVKNIKYVDF